MFNLFVSIIALVSYTVGILTDHLILVTVEGIILIYALTKFLEGLRKEKH